MRRLQLPRLNTEGLIDCVAECTFVAAARRINKGDLCTDCCCDAVLASACFSDYGGFAESPRSLKLQQAAGQ
ncbi:hypothetical protein N7497_003420 [Penicillium chrysogenum]|nr:hypothetical protein N7497_003420 [Penicillium chrysogenum]